MPRQPADGDYRDDGCFLHPVCLVCPEPVCVLDLQGGVVALQSLKNQLRALEMKQSGVPVAEISVALSLSVHTIYILLRKPLPPLINERRSNAL